MAGLYNRGKKGLLDGSINWSSDDIRVLLVGTGYSFNPDHNVVADVVASEVTGTGYARKALASKTAAQNDTVDRGELDAADLTWVGIDAGAVGGAVLFKQVTTDSDSELIGFIDTGGFPVTTNGTDLTLAWASTGILHGVQG